MNQIAHDKILRSPGLIHPAEGSSFGWSIVKLRKAAMILLIATLPAAFGIAASGTTARSLCLAWLLEAAVLMHCIHRRAATEGAVLTIDERGILDRRLMSRRMDWHEIESIYPVDIRRSRVVDLSLGWPDMTLSGTRWRTRIGAFCQNVYGVPAVTISMLLLEGEVTDLLAAIARVRPGLVQTANLPSCGSSPAQLAEGGCRGIDAA